jgi:predicted RNA-binding protein YlqC (UPF0109 family)
MKEFIEYVTKQLVDSPSQVHVDEIIGQHVVIYELHVGDGDMGMVIGKRGRTVDSLRTLLAVASAKQGKRSALEIVETNRTRKSLQVRKTQK